MSTNLRRGTLAPVCGRYTLASPNPAEVRARFNISESVEVRRRYNVAPGDDVLAVTPDKTGEPRGELLRWGLVPAWSKEPSTGLKMINARVETAAERPAYRRAFERYRCLIVADGFYEWQPVPGAPKQPFHITRADGDLFAFAGLWSIWHAPDGGTLRTCTILTTAANAAIAPLHDRMPIILAPDAERAWLDTTTRGVDLADILAGLPAAGTAARPVGTAVNDARYDGPECLATPPEPVQTALF
jgi:putative SOS response-associated peptidase YedK